MKNLIVLLLISLPMVLFSAAPTCLDGMEVSLVDCNGKVVKTGKLNSQGKLTLDGADPACAWDVKLSNNGQSIILEVNTANGGIDKATPIMYKTNGDIDKATPQLNKASGKGGKATPLMYNKKMSDVKGGSELMKSSHEAAHVVQQKSGLRAEAGLDETNSADRVEGNINTSRGNIKNQNKRSNNGNGDLEDCDDANISVTAKGNGKVEITVSTIK